MYSIILADETIMKKKYFNFVTLWFCLITFIDVSIPLELNIEIPSEPKDAWNFGQLVERRMINALSTVLYAHQNDLKIVPTKSLAFGLQNLIVENTWGEPSSGISEKEAEKVQPKLSKQNGKDKLTFAHDIPGMFPSENSGDNHKRKEKEILAALLGTGRPVSTDTQKMETPIDDTIRYGIQKMNEDLINNQHLSPNDRQVAKRNFRKALGKDVMEKLMVNLGKGSHYIKLEKKNVGNYDANDIVCNSKDKCTRREDIVHIDLFKKNNDQNFRQYLEGQKEAMIKNAQIRVEFIKKLPDNDVINVLDKHFEQTEIDRWAINTALKKDNLSEDEKSTLEALKASTPNAQVKKDPSKLKKEIRYLQLHEAIPVPETEGTIQKTPKEWIPFQKKTINLEEERKKSVLPSASTCTTSRRRRDISGTCAIKKKFGNLVNSHASSSIEDVAIKTQLSVNTVGQGLSTVGDATESKKFDLKKAKKLLSAIANCFQILDGAMAIFSLIQMFLPASDSPELAFMKSQFGIVNTKLDSVLTGQDKISAAVDFLSLTNHIDVAKIESMNELVVSFLPELRNELANNGNLSIETKYKLENFKTQFDQSQLVFITQTLLWSVTDPQRAAIGGDKNILQLYQDKKTNDCKATLAFGFRVIEHLRKARPVINFYYQFQVLSEAPIEWDDELYKVIEKTYFQAQFCLTNSQFFVKQDMGNFINNKEPSDIVSILQEKYYIHEYFVIKLNTADEFEHHDIYDPHSSVMEKKQGQSNDKKLIVIERPYSRYVNGCKFYTSYCPKIKMNDKN